MNATTRRGLLSLVAVATVAGGAALLTLRDRPAVAPAQPLPTDVVTAAAWSTLHHVVGTHRSWKLRFDGQSVTLPLAGVDTATPGEPISATVHIGARLHQQVVATAADGSAHLRLWLENIESAELRVQDVVASQGDTLAAELARASIDLRVDRCGVILEVASAADGGVGRQIVQSIAEAAMPAICGEPAADRHIARHLTPHGDAGDTLQMSFDRGVSTITIEQRQYSSLRVDPSGLAAIDVEVDGHTVVRDGAIEAVSLVERVTADGTGARLLDATTDVALVEPTDHEPIELATAVGAWMPAGSRPDGSSARSLLERRAGDLDGNTLVATLTAYGASGTVPNHNDFLWRAPARLELEPALVDELAALAESPEYTSAGRALVLDLLSQTDSDAAARAVMDVLQSSAVRADRVYPLLLQRSGFVAHPPAEMVNWLMGLAGSPDFNERTSARYSLGSVVSSLDGDERTGEADAAHRVLTQALTDSATPDERVHGLRALANAARPADVAAIASHAADASADVRAAVAASLAGFDLGPSTETLLELAEDRDVTVQRAAIAALREHSLASDALASLGAVARGPLDRRNAMALLDLAKYYVETESVAVVAIADAVIAMQIDGSTTAAAHELRRRATMSR